MTQRLFNKPLLLGLLLISLMPTLYLVQVLVKRGDSNEVWLSGTLEVGFEGSKPLMIQLVLHEQKSNQGIALQGESALLDGEYPWDPMPILSQFWLHLNPDAQAPGDTDAKLEWAASYTQRRKNSPNELWLPPLPCKGRITTKDSSRQDPGKTLSSYTKLRLALDLTCTSAGPDLLWSSGDERNWTLRGPLDLSRGPRP